jgi:hypothetical protein
MENPRSQKLLSNQAHLNHLHLDHVVSYFVLRLCLLVFMYFQFYFDTFEVLNLYSYVKCIRTDLDKAEMLFGRGLRFGILYGKPRTMTTIIFFIQY